MTFDEKSKTAEIMLPSKRVRLDETKAHINDYELNRIGSGVGPNSLMDIARSYLNVPEHDIETYEASVRGDIKRLKFKILEHWRNQNPGPDARGKLFDLLDKARKAHGGIDIQSYKFLKDVREPDIDRKVL